MYIYKRSGMYVILTFALVLHVVMLCMTDKLAHQWPHSTHCPLCVTYLYPDDVLWAGGLGSLQTLAELRDFLILPDYEINQIQMCVQLLSCLTSNCMKQSSVTSSLFICLYLRCKSSCSWTPWFSRVWVEIVESLFWIFCFSSLISSFKELMVWEQITEVSQHKTRDMIRVQTQQVCVKLCVCTWLAVFSLISRSSSFLLRLSRFLQRARFASIWSDRFLAASVSFSSNFLIRPKRFWLRSISCCKIKGSKQSFATFSLTLGLWSLLWLRDCSCLLILCSNLKLDQMGQTMPFPQRFTLSWSTLKVLLHMLKCFLLFFVQLLPLMIHTSCLKKLV